MKDNTNLFFFTQACCSENIETDEGCVSLLIWQNYIEPGGTVLKDQAILDIKQCYLNSNRVNVI